MDGEDILLIFVKGMVVLFFTLLAFLIVVAAIEHPVPVFITIGCIALVFGLGAIVHFVEWEYRFDDIKIFFRRFKNIKIEWKNDEDR